MRRWLLLVPLLLVGWNPAFQQGVGVLGGGVEVLFLSTGAAQDWEGSTLCALEQGVSNVVGIPDCDCQSGTSACPLAGSDSLYMVGVGAGAPVVEHDSGFSSASNIVVCDMLLHIDDAEGGSADIFQLTDGTAEEGGAINHFAGTSIRFKTHDSSVTSTWSYTLDTTYNVRLLYGATAAACSTLGLADSGANGDCVKGCVDTGATWGSCVEFNASQDGAGVAADIDGFDLIANQIDIIYDDVACCAGALGSSKCGG